MLGHFKLKINIAIVISVAIIFRLLFINIGLLSSFSTPQTNNLLSNYFSGVQKNKPQDQTDVKANVKDYTAMYVCDEGSDNKEDLVKASSPAISFLFFCFVSRILFTEKLNSSFDLIKCDIHPKRYLALSILRI